MPRRKQVWVGGAGIGVELVCVAAVALNAPTVIWVLALITGAFLIVYSFIVGEDSSNREGEKLSVGGGGGDGDVRGNIFGDNAQINISSSPASPKNHLKGRTLVRQSVNDLIGLYRDHTQVQAEKLAQPYLGGWLLVEGKVNDVTRQSKGYSVAIGVEGHFVFATFLKAEQEHLPRLQRDDPLHVIGRISNIDPLWLRVEDCELLSPDES